MTVFILDKALARERRQCALWRVAGAGAADTVEDEGHTYLREAICAAVARTGVSTGSSGSS